jgi:hypothetical protein
LEEVRREFSGLPVYVGVEDGYVYVKKTAPMDQRLFRKYLETCRRLGFDRRGERWVKPLEDRLGLFVNRSIQLTTSHTYWTSPTRVAYTASLTAATAGHHASATCVGGDTAPLATSTAPVSASAAPT